MLLSGFGKVTNLSKYSTGQVASGGASEVEGIPWVDRPGATPKRAIQPRDGWIH